MTSAGPQQTALIARVSRLAQGARMKPLHSLALLGLLVSPLSAQTYVEPPALAAQVTGGQLPAVAERLPKTPIVVDPAAGGGQVGQYGGQIVTLVPRARDIRYISTYAYTRLVGYDRKLMLQPDILERADVEGERVFTFTMREGHRWSDGHSFTAEDFRYFWEDVAQSKDLSPAGVPEFMLVDGKPPKFELLNERTVRYTWEKPNPRFLPQLAGARDPYIYRASHYLKRYHAKYADKAALDEEAKKQKLKSWAALHNRLDDMNEQSNPALPTLQAWRVTNAGAGEPLRLRAQPLLSPGRHRRSAAALRRSHRHGRGGERAAGREGQRGRDRPPVPRPLHERRADPEGGRARQGLQDPAVAERPRHRARALPEPQRRRPRLAGAEPRRALPPRPVARHRPQDPQQGPALRPRHGGQQHGDAESPLFSPELRTANATYDPAEASRLLDEIGLTTRKPAPASAPAGRARAGDHRRDDGEGGLIVDGLT
jgi:peptide/nickel transport system substrate-binding protein